ncbi:MAG: MerR family transcriptional regulator [Prevotellaceae bacterium]|nr:MerR family transcriptional regulator [Candidatus Faecinaster equi]
MYNEEKNLKVFYSINEVAKKFNVAESLLRYWEKEFPQLKPHKAGRNIRQYTKEDIDKIALIYDLVKVRGLKIAAARELLTKNKQATKDIVEVINKMKGIREKLSNIRHNMSLLIPDDEDDVSKVYN